MRNGKEKSGGLRWLPTDTLLVILLVLSLAGIGLRAWKRSAPEQAYGEAFPVLAVWRDVDRRTAACLTVGELLYTPSGVAFGEVAEIRTVPVVRTLTQGGTVISGSIPDDGRCDAEVTVLVYAEADDGLLRRAGGGTVCVGACYELFGDRTHVMLSVLALNVAEK